MHLFRVGLNWKDASKRLIVITNQSSLKLNLLKHSPIYIFLDECYKGYWMLLGILLLVYDTQMPQMHLDFIHLLRQNKLKYEMKNDGQLIKVLNGTRSLKLCLVVPNSHRYVFTKLSKIALN